MTCVIAAFIIIYYCVNCKFYLIWSFLKDQLANCGMISHTNAELSAEFPFPALRVWHNYLIYFLK